MVKKSLIILSLLTSVALAQKYNNGNIKGTVKTFDNYPVELANVFLKGTSKGGVTKSDGEYEIKNVEPGTYKLEASFMGFLTSKVEVEVKAGLTTHVPTIYLKETASQLHEITIVSNKINKFSNMESQYVAKLPVRDIENPQSYSTTSSELLSEENITNYSSAAGTISGGVLSAENPQGLSAVYVRGFQTNSFIRNGLYSFSWNGGDPQVMERIELIKGPSGPIYGPWGISYGGLVNIVTKKPFNGKYFQGGITFGSYNLHRFTGDFNTPLDEKQNLLFRINIASHSEDSFQDIGHKKTTLIAPSFFYKINNNLNILLEAELNSLDFSANSILAGTSGLTVNRIDQVKRNYFKSYSSEKLNPQPGTSDNYFGKINYIFQNNWKLSANFALADFSLPGSSVLLNFISDSSLARELYDYKLGINNTDIQTNLTGDFFVLGERNRFLFGIDYQWIDIKTIGSIIFAADTVDYIKNISPILNVNKLRNNYDYTLNTYESRNSYAAYISDLLNLNNSLNFLLSLRYDYNDYNGLFNVISGSAINRPYLKGVFSPQIGITYQVMPGELSFFSNYMQGFNYVQPDLVGNSFSPELAEQIEAGVKCSLFKKKFYATISFYNISVKITLKKRGFRTNIFYSAKDAIEFLKDNNPSLGVLDIRLSDDVSGIEVAKNLKERDIPFIFCSAFSDPKNLQMAKNLTPLAIVKKPLIYDNFELAIDKYHDIYE